VKFLDSLRYRRRVDEWVDRCILTQARLDNAVKAFAGHSSMAGLHLEPNERLIAAAGVDLLETRRIRVTNYGSVSHHTRSHNTVRAGQARSESHEELRQVDRGQLIITDRRIMYLGSKPTEVRWPKLIQNYVGPTSAEFQATGRRSPLRVAYDRRGGERLQFMFQVAFAALDGSEDDFVRGLALSAADARSQPPHPPEGIDVDPRVENLVIDVDGKTPTQIPSVLPPHLEPPDDWPSMVRGQFNSTSVEIVAPAAAAFGWQATAIAVAQDGSLDPDIIPLLTPPGVPPQDFKFTVFACLPDNLNKLIMAIEPAISVLVSPVAVEGLTVLDKDDTEPNIVITDPNSVDAICASRTESGAAIRQIPAASTLDLNVLLKLNTQLRLARAVSGKSQIVVVLDSQLGDAGTKFPGADEIIIVSDDVVEAPETLIDDQDFQSPLTPVDPIKVAGTQIKDPAERVRTYLLEHARTISSYDRTAGTYESVTPELIAATRVLHSRITHNEAEWFIKQAESAPWESVKIDAQLIDADPCAKDSLYDNGSALYNHFRSAAPKGIKAAKIYKVLHLMRPGLFPILDSRLAELYEGPAREAALKVNACRPDLSPSTHAYWAAIRKDLIAASNQIAAIRAALAASSDPYVTDSIQVFSDLRILDMLSWQDGISSDN
jgi:hypothetical protein